MKIALLLSGNLRTFDLDQSPKISDYYKKMCEKYDMDVFCFTDDHNFIYNGVQHLKKNVNDEYDMGHYAIKPNHTFIDGSQASEIIEKLLYNCFGNYLKKMKIIPYYRFFVPMNIENDYHNRFYNDNCRPINMKHNIVNNCFKVWKAYELLQEYEKESGVVYDIIIKSRFDCIPYDILNNIDIRQIDYNNTLICGHWSGFLFDHGAIGNRYIMHHYCNYYNNLSPNLLDNIRMYWAHILAPGKCSHEQKDGMKDISDSIEYGLTYLIKTIHSYDLKHYNINFRHFIAGDNPNC
jgi:hypothetical protein